MFDWHQLPKPIFGLAPMDGITDAAFRTMVYRHGPPDILFTEFVSAEGLSRKIPSMLSDLEYENHERPMIAQIFGCEIEAFRKCMKILIDLKFDGIDINMGCPAKNVVHRGGGAGLIKAAENAKKIISVCAEELQKHFDETGEKIPLSVKTRLGYEKITIKEWIGRLLECRELSNISLHGRTFRQMYTGAANWEAIGEAVELAKGSGISILGNGDLTSFSDAMEKIRHTGVDGVLFGRGTYGKPWFFKEKEKFRNGLESISPENELQSSLRERFEILLEHATLLHQKKNPKKFIQIRKHIGWYLKGFENASEMRNKLCQTNSLEELKLMIEPYVSSQAA